VQQDECWRNVRVPGQDGPQTPHTPSSPRTRSNLASTGRSFDGPTGHNGRDLSSPTPNRKDDTLPAGNSPLTHLQSDNVLLKSSTREQLRRLINSEVRIYETKLEEFQESVSVLGDQLDRLEIEGDE